MQGYSWYVWDDSNSMDILFSVDCRVLCYTINIFSFNHNWKRACSMMLIVLTSWFSYIYFLDIDQNKMDTLKNLLHDDILKHEVSWMFFYKNYSTMI